jgi:hypothetical protein
MKTSNGKFGILVLVTIIAAGSIFTSCSKSNSGGGGGGGTTGPTPPTNPGGYDSANQIQPSSLIAYFPFNGNDNDVKSGLVGTNQGTTFGTGVKGQALQGGDSTWVVVPFGSSASLFSGASLPSFTVSLWIKEAAEPIYAPSGNYTPGQGPEGVLFMYDGAGDQDLIHMDIEPYAPTTQDTLSFNVGLHATGLVTTGTYVGAGGSEGLVPNARLDTAIGKWTHVVETFDGTSSNFTVYENGTAVFVNSAWSSYAAGPSPVQFLTGGTTDAGSVPIGALSFTPAPVGLVIGAWAGTAQVGGFTPNQYTGSFKGLMDELRIYKTALSASDVKSLYILEQAGF